MMIKVFKGQRREGKTTLLVKEICEFIDGSLEGDVIVVTPLAVGGVCIRERLEEYYGKRVRKVDHSKMTLWGDRDIYFLSSGYKAIHGKICRMLAIDESDYIKQELKEALYPCVQKGGVIVETETIGS